MIDPIMHGLTDQERDRVIARRDACSGRDLVGEQTCIRALAGWDDDVVAVRLMLTGGSLVDTEDLGHTRIICECCWNNSRRDNDDYGRMLKEHKERGCVCTQDSEEGRKARAGQFWQDGRDTRPASRSMRASPPSQLSGSGSRPSWSQSPTPVARAEKQGGLSQ